MNNAFFKYQTQQIMTASPARLVCLLYDRAILSLKEAIAAIEAGKVEGRWRANKRAIEIVTHMWATLDVERGGEIAKNLSDLFSYIVTRLPEVDFQNDPTPAREVIELLEPLRDSWHKVANGKTERPALPGPLSAQRPAATAGGEGARTPTSFSA